MPPNINESMSNIKIGMYLGLLSEFKIIVKDHE